MEHFKILIIDDTTENLKVMVSVFQKFMPNYELFQTNNSVRALGIAQKVIPDLIITDWEMPEVSGLELINKLKSNSVTKEIPVIMVTGVMLTPDHLKTALAAGAIDYVRKPIEPVELIARTKAALLITNYHRQVIVQKDQELTKSAIHLVRSQEFITGFAANLEATIQLIDEEPQNAKSTLIALAKVLQDKSNQESWSRFNLSFSNVHANFASNLTAECPRLTPADVKICSFVRLGMANKEIAAVLNQSPDSVKVSRYRLRKKIGLKRVDNLENFLSRF